VLTSEGAYEQALAEIDIALGLDSESFEVNTAAARLYFMQGLHNDAIRFYEKAAALMPTDFSSVAMLQTCYTAIGDTEAVRRAAERTLARAEKIAAQEPDNGMAMGYTVIALADLGEGERARELAKRAMLLDPDNLTMLYNFGCSFARLRDFEMAIDVLGPVLEKDTAETVNWAKADPDLDGVREHPRFKAMLAKADARLRGE
jgi:adenylate cyclase